MKANTLSQASKFLKQHTGCTVDTLTDKITIVILNRNDQVIFESLYEWEVIDTVNLYLSGPKVQKVFWEVSHEQKCLHHSN